MIQIPSQTIFYKIESTIKEYRRFAYHNLKRMVDDITIDQALLLLFLNDNPQLSQNEIAKLVFKDNASVTRMIELMIQNNYLNREVNIEDRRKFKLTLTGKGNRVLKEISPVISTNRDAALQGISKTDMVHFSKILDKITKNCASL